ncbi:MAG: cupin domain-containing protein [Parcubacteria group bacterium]
MRNAIISEIPKFKVDDRGIIRDCGKVRLISRKKWSISANHEHEAVEVLFLVSGEIELEVGGEKEILSGYKRIEIPGNVHHTVRALTDIVLLEDRELS